MALEPCTSPWTSDGDHGSDSCPRRHETYAAALARFVDRTPTPWTLLPAKSKRFRPVLCVDPSTTLSSSKPQYCALLPIPARKLISHRLVGESGSSPLAYIRGLCRARCLDGSDAAEALQGAWAPDRRQSADVVWMGSGHPAEDCGSGPFYSLVARGEAHQVDRVIEAVAFLMDSSNAMSHTERVASIADHFQRLRDGRAQYSHDLLDLRRPRPQRPRQQDAAASSAAQPVAAGTASSAAPPVATDSFCLYALNDSCSRYQCQLPTAHVGYRELFLRHLDRSRKSSSALKARYCSAGELFHPRLFAESESADSWVALLPMPGLLVSSLLGTWAHQRGILTICMEKACRQSSDSMPAIDVVAEARGLMSNTTWSEVTVRGRASEVDAVLSAVFFIIVNASAWKRELASLSERATHVQSHVTAFKRRRAELTSPLAAGEFLSLRTSNTSPAAAPAVSTSAGAAQPCMAAMHPDGCRQPRCTYSHAPYVDLFVAHCDRQPTTPSQLPSTTRLFHPVLATVPHSFPLLYVVSFPFPRILKVVERSTPSSSSSSVVAALKVLTNANVELGQLRGNSWRAHHTDDVAEDWLALRAQGTKEQIDTLMEWVFWHMERGVHIADDRDRADGIRQHLPAFRHQRSETVLGADDFFSLVARGAPAFPSAPPLTTSPFSSAQPRAPASPPLAVPESRSPEPPANSWTSTSSSSGPSSAASAVSSASGASFSPAAALVAQSLSPYLSLWHDAGRSVTISSALHVPDLTPLPVAYLRCLPSTTFACFSIAAVPAVREQFALEVMAGAMRVSAIEDTFGVAVFVPRVPSGPSNTAAAAAAGAAAAAQQPWLSVTVWKDHTGGGGDSEDVARCRLQVEDALRALMARHDAMVSALKLATAPIPTASAPAGAKRPGGPSSEAPEGKRAKMKEL